MKKIIILTLCVLGYTIGQAQVLTEEQKAKELLQKATNAYNNESYEAALEYYKEADTYYSKYFDADAYYNMGNSYKDLENYSQAIICYQKAISINPNFAEAYVYMAISYGISGNNNKAINCMQKAARLGDKVAQDFLKSKDYSW